MLPFMCRCGFLTLGCKRERQQKNLLNKYYTVKFTTQFKKINLLGYVHYWFSCHFAPVLCYGNCHTEHTCQSFFTYYRWGWTLHNLVILFLNVMWAINICNFVEELSWNTCHERYDCMSVKSCHSSVLWQCVACMVRLGAFCLNRSLKDSGRKP